MFPPCLDAAHAGDMGTAAQSTVCFAGSSSTDALGLDRSMSEPELVLGTAQLTERYGILGASRNRQRSAHSILAAAERLGVRTLDTAPAYGGAEAVIGTYGWSGAVHTKIRVGVPPAESLMASLSALRRDQVEVLYVHDSNEVLNPCSSVLYAANQLEREAVGVVGASVYSLEEFTAAIEHPMVDVVQVPMSVLDRRFHGAALAAADSASTKVYARSVFLQGLLLANPAELPATVSGLRSYISGLQAIADAHETTRTALALGWARSQAGLAGILVGVRDERELEEVVTAWQEPVPPAAFRAVNELETPAPELLDPRRWSR